MIYDSNNIIKLINEKREDGLHISTEDQLLAYTKKNSDNKVLLKPDEIKKAYSQLRLNMSEHMRLDNIVFLFGNGASIYAGSKNTTQTQLTNYLTDKEYSDIAGVINNICEKIPNSIEEQLNALNTASGFYSLMSDPKGELVNKLITSIKSGLLTDYVNSINYKKLYLHDNMLLKLRNFDCLNKTRIYTLNYD